jgi:hypothetical protein
MYILNDITLSPDRGFIHPVTGVQYPSNWLRLSSLAEKHEIGIVEVPDPEPYDERFYWGVGQPKDHAQLVALWTDTTRTTANTLLQPTDWIIIREADNGKPADPALKQWREDIRAASGVKIAAIAATTDTAELAAYITGAEYHAWPVDPYAPAADGLEPAGDQPTV